MTSMMDCFKVKDVVEVFQDYKKSAVLFSMCYCDWKCCKEAGVDVCQNLPLAKQEIIGMSFSYALSFVNKSMTDAIIFGGLEPLLQAEEVIHLIHYFREHGVQKDIVVFTGYYIEEIDKDVLESLTQCHVILKCGRFIPNRPSKFDDVLGVTLASDNQYGVQL